MLDQPRGSRRQFLKTSVAATLAGGLLFERGLKPAWADSLATTNENILADRQVALGILSPKEADVLRGLELHANSVVLESYGFSPSAAIDGEAFQQAVDDGASDAELVDLREEMSKTRFATDEAERREFLEAFHASGVTATFQNAGESGNDPLRLIKRLAYYTYSTDRMGDDLRKATHPDDVVAAKQAGKVALVFTTNGVPLRQQWENVRDELRYIRLFKQLGVQMMHVTYNRRNPLGDGVGEPNDGGLSDFGHAAVAEMNRQGVIVDVAHSSWRTSLQAARASSKPMVASHTTCAGLYEHFRGKPDNVVKAICDTGGLIGICCIPRFLGGTGDIRVFLDHIDYAIRTFGADHVAIGVDTGYSSRNRSAERAKVKPRRDGRSPLSVPGARWEKLWPEDNFRTTPEATRSLAWTNWPLFTVGMVQRGHSDETIRKILGENMLRVWRENLV